MDGPAAAFEKEMKPMRRYILSGVMFLLASACGQGGGEKEAAAPTPETSDPSQETDVAADTAQEGAEEPQTQTSTSQDSGLASRGRSIFGVACGICHDVSAPGEPGHGRLAGPSLYGVIGREAGAMEGFEYSEAMANADFVWNEDTLDQYIHMPRDFLPGNRMGFAGEPNGDRRAAIIAYLKSVQ